MILWKRVENLQYKLCQKAFENYSNSDYYVYQNVINNTFRVCIGQQPSEFIFETENMQEINEFFSNLYNESIAL